MEFDNTQAMEEGWELGFVRVDKKLIVRSHGCIAFRNDIEAVAFVMWRAMLGSEYHMRALEINFA